MGSQYVASTYLFTWAKRGSVRSLGNYNNYHNLNNLILDSVFRNSCCTKYIKLIIIKTILIMKMWKSSSFKKVYYRNSCLEKNIKIRSIKTLGTAWKLTSDFIKLRVSNVIHVTRCKACLHWANKMRNLYRFSCKRRKPFCNNTTSLCNDVFFPSKRLWSLEI